MLPKKRRISRGEISMLVSNGRRYNSAHFLLYLHKSPINKDIFDTKLSFSASKKVCKKATDRNKLRRRGYSAVGKLLSRISKGYMCLFVYKKSSFGVKYEIIEKEIIELLSLSSVLT